MTKKRNISRYLFLFIFLLACSKEDPQPMEDFVTLYGGAPFKGTAVGIRSVSGSETHRWDGTGSIALIETSPDSVSLIFMADIADIGEVNLKVRGAYGRDHFQATGPDHDFSISDGKVDGHVANDQQAITFGGTMSRGQSVLAVRVEFLQGQEGFPGGSALELHFDTRRDLDDDPDGGEGCGVRLVPIWGPSGMTMGMVPDC